MYDELHQVLNAGRHEPVMLGITRWYVSLPLGRVILVS